MTKLYCDQELSHYLKGLGCESGSEWGYRASGNLVNYHRSVPVSTDTPAFELEDLLREDNAIKIWGEDEVDGSGWREEEVNRFIKENPGKNVHPWTYSGRRWRHFTKAILEIFQSHPETWPEEIKKMIMK